MVNIESRLTPKDKRALKRRLRFLEKRVATSSRDLSFDEAEIKALTNALGLIDEVLLASKKGDICLKRPDTIY